MAALRPLATDAGNAAEQKAALPGLAYRSASQGMTLPARPISIRSESCRGGAGELGNACGLPWTRSAIPAATAVSVMGNEVRDAHQNYDRQGPAARRR